MVEYADATPAKRFFIEMLTRDIRLEDAVLDLIDNAIDSIIRHKDIDLQSLVTTLGRSRGIGQIDQTISVWFGDDSFSIKDNCGGIDIRDAKDFVFRFGSQSKPPDSRLSVYGIGLKRAVFKIGRDIEIVSRTLTSGFKVKINVDTWEKEQGDWRFPIEEIPAAENVEDAGTSICIKKITPASVQRFKSGSLETRLADSIGRSYSLFIDRFVRVELNGTKVEAHDIPISNSDEAQTSISREKYENVEITIVAGLQKLMSGSWRGSTAGWYVLCNGRVVVFADKTELSGWGSRALPMFQPKHRGFIGVVLFLSDDPETLPWTTTKRGINAEMPVYQNIRERMATDARQVISFLDKRYSSIPVSSENTDNLDVRERVLATALKPVQLSQLFGGSPRRFSTSQQITKKTRMTNVQYKTESTNISRAKRVIGDSNQSAGKVGLHALMYFLENESEK